MRNRKYFFKKTLSFSCMLVLTAFLRADISHAIEPGSSMMLSGMEKDSGLFESRIGREVDRIVSSPLQRLPSNARSRGWAELGLHARSGEGPGTLVASPFGSVYYRLAEPVFATLSMGAVTELVFDGDLSFLSDAHIGNPYLGAAFELPFEGVNLQLLGGFTIPLAGIDGEDVYAFAEGIRGGWSPWYWAPGRLSVVLGARFDIEGQGDFRFGAEGGAAPMFWFADGERSTIMVMQGSFHASLVVAEILDIGARAFAVSKGDDSGVQVSSEIFANIQGERMRIYHARLTLPISEPYGFAFSENGFWGLHIGAGMVF